MAEAIRDGLRLEGIAAHMAGDRDTAMSLLRIDAHDIAVDRDVSDHRHCARRGISRRDAANTGREGGDRE